MVRKILFLKFLICLIFLGVPFASPATDTEFFDCAMLEEYQVKEICHFEDPDEGAFFILNDGSIWLRTWWEGPVYTLSQEQTIHIISMTDQEIKEHQQGWYRHFQPFWIVLPREKSSCEIGIAFKIR